MKRITTYIFAVAAILAVSCDNNIPKTGTINNALVEQVIFDDVLSVGLELMVGNTFKIPEHISALPIDATNTAQRYESSKPDIADVSDSGELVAKQIGECVITVYVGSDGICAEFPVKVVRMPYINISSLRFNQTETEYEITEGSVNMKKLLYVGSASDTEDATEPVLFSSSDESVATIDADGVLTIHKLGETIITASAEESQITPATITVKFFRWVEYERFPGDKSGQPRTIMGETASAWNALPHTDGGWELTEFCWINDQSKKDKWNATDIQRNCYRYAMLDGRYIVSRGAASGSLGLPVASNGTAFVYQRPGGNKQSVETDGVYFIIDMKESHIVNYFRIVNISSNADDRAVFVTRISEIQGSNDNSQWKTIATDLEGFNSRSTPTHTSETVYPLKSDKALFDNTEQYRYIKFILKQKDRCYGYFNNPSDADADRTGNAMQIAELYMGCKAYSE